MSDILDGESLPALNRGSALTVYVPRPGTAAARLLAPRSAVVGEADQTSYGDVVCHFEGAIYGQAGMERFYARLCHASGRLVSDHPTIAIAGFNPADLIPVARFDGRRQVLTEVTNAPVLEDWCGESAADIIGVRLPSGEANWEDAVAAAEPPARRVGPAPSGANQVIWFRTQSGQVISYDQGSRRARVYDHGDPALAVRLPNLSEVHHRLVFG